MSSILKVQGMRKLDLDKCHETHLMSFSFKDGSAGLNAESFNQIYYGLDTFHVTTGMCLLGGKNPLHSAIKAYIFSHLIC